MRHPTSIARGVACGYRSEINAQMSKIVIFYHGLKSSEDAMFFLYIRWSCGCGRSNEIPHVCRVDSVCYLSPVGRTALEIDVVYTPVLGVVVPTRHHLKTVLRMVSVIMSGVDASLYDRFYQLSSSNMSVVAKYPDEKAR